MMTPASTGYLLFRMFSLAHLITNPSPHTDPLLSLHKLLEYTTKQGGKNRVIEFISDTEKICSKSVVCFYYAIFHRVEKIIN